jgi:hypothetical protein
MRHASLLASALVLALSIVSTTFVFLALTSPRWAVQNYYFSGVIGAEGDGSLDVNRLTWAYRSPFYRCGVPEVYKNKTAIVPFCKFYKPYGKDRTSCRTTGEMGLTRFQVIESQGLLGTAQECQQGEIFLVGPQAIHYDGRILNRFTALSPLRWEFTDRGVRLPGLSITAQPAPISHRSDAASQGSIHLGGRAHNPPRAQTR